MRRCSRCGKLKPVSEFHERTTNTYCRLCTKTYNREYYQRHSERLKEQVADYKARDPEGKRERDAAYRNANREKLRAWHREHRKTPERRAAESIHTTVRRAQKKATQVVSFSAEQLEAKFAYWNNCCWVCGESATTVDHVKPLSRGGAHMLCNMRPACEDCNFAKHNAWPLPSRAQILGFCS